MKGPEELDDEEEDDDENDEEEEDTDDVEEDDVEELCELTVSPRSNARYSSNIPCSSLSAAAVSRAICPRVTKESAEMATGRAIPRSVVART